MVEYNENVTINAPYKLILKNTDYWWVELRCLQNVYDAPGILEVSGHIKCLKDIAAYGGALMTASAPGTTGGGAIQMGHAWERSDDPPRINLTDDNYHTLYITAGSSVGVGADAVLADMKLKKLTATDGAKLNAVAIGRDEYGDIPYEYESIQLNPAHNLRFYFGTNQRMVLSNAGRLELPVQGSSGGLKVGDDTNLYRSAQDVLKTDDSFVCYNITGNDAIFNSVTGTASGAFKVGTAGGTTYVSLTRSGSIGYLTSHYGDLRLASTGTIWFESPASPTGAGTKNLGSASAYWNEVNAKSFIDRGCPFWIEPHEAREILKEIKPHPTLKSVNTFKDTEVPQFDYSSLPEILKPNEGDGIRTEALLYTVFHVVRDLVERVEALEMKAG
ncbi:hypothetical protein G4O51_07150 [Candidatus Bathyarchaeota archaeon A05DMB-2]|nr:hypothetical protein [Candidatus Bathyarchaeota archaeon A05DMB-2]